MPDALHSPDIPQPGTRAARAGSPGGLLVVAIAWLLIDTMSAGAASSLMPPAFPGTEGMAERLITEQANPEQHPHLNDRLVAMYRGMLPTVAQGQESSKVRSDYTRQLLPAGRSAEALRAWEELDRFAVKQRIRICSHGRRTCKFFRALTYLRSGDQDVSADMGAACSGDTYRNSPSLNPGRHNHWLALRLDPANDPYCDPATLALKSALTHALTWPR